MIEIVPTYTVVCADCREVITHSSRPHEYLDLERISINHALCGRQEIDLATGEKIDNNDST